MPAQIRRPPLPIRAGLLVFLFSFQIPLLPIRADNDTWWHLKTGQYLLETGPLFPEHDVFSQTGADQEWVNHEWLSDILFYMVYKYLGGPMALIVFLSLVYACTGVLLFLAAARRSGTLPAGLALALCAVWSGQHSVLTRPPMLSYLLFVVFILTLERFWHHAFSPRRTAAILAMVVLWSNLHGGVILAVVVAGAYALSAWLLHRDRRAWTLFGPAVLLAAMGNPWGYKVLALTFKVARDPVLTSLIVELAPPDFIHFKVFWAFVVGSLALLVLARDRRQAPLWLLSAFFLWQGTSHVRHVPLAALTLALAASGAFPAARRAAAPLLPVPRWFTLAATVLSAALLALASWLIFDTRNRPFLHFRGVVEDAYPKELCDFLIAHPLPGPMFNDINYAGYLIWRLSPEPYKVWTDSRFDIHGSGPARILSSMRAGNDPFTVKIARENYNPILGQAPDDKPYWRAILDWIDPGFIVTSTTIGPKHRLEARLSEENSGWVKVFSSPPKLVRFSRYWPPWEFGGYAIYVRDTPENADLIASARRAWLTERLK
ncbi:hypothetical protein HS125_10190 [bacterium]|nr:hypothetical protein [bacterium]